MTDVPVHSIQHVIVTPTKSVGVAILLTLLFGPLGLFYATVRGALVVLFLMPVGALCLGSVLAALGSRGDSPVGVVAAIALIPMTAFAMWVASLVWSVVAVNSYNRRLLAAHA